MFLLERSRQVRKAGMEGVYTLMEKYLHWMASIVHSADRVAVIAAVPPPLATDRGRYCPSRGPIAT
jgi:hypothetical protein